MKRVNAVTIYRPKKRIILVRVPVGDRSSCEINVTGQFRKAFGGKLNAKILRAIFATAPRTLEVLFESGPVRISEDSIESWYQRTLRKMLR